MLKYWACWSIVMKSDFYTYMPINSDEFWSFIMIHVNRSWRKCDGQTWHMSINHDDYWSNKANVVTGAMSVATARDPTAEGGAMFSTLKLMLIELEEVGTCVCMRLCMYVSCFCACVCVCVCVCVSEGDGHWTLVAVCICVWLHVYLCHKYIHTYIYIYIYIYHPYI